MPDPVIRRLSCAATLYFEVAPDGLSLARVFVDVPIPPLPLPDSQEEAVEAAASEALARWMGGEPVEAAPPAGPLSGSWEPSCSYGQWEVAA